MTATEQLRDWGDWVQLKGAGRNHNLPRLPGLYRVRRVGAGGLDYIGQTGRSIRERLGSLGGVYRDEMPYNDPHTAGPGLWGLRHRDGCDFEAAGLPLHHDKRLRGPDGSVPVPAPSLPVPGSLNGEVMSLSWVGLVWSTFQPIGQITRDVGIGLYRVRRLNLTDRLLYVGEGNVASRLRAHQQKASNQDHRQAELFTGELEASVVEAPDAPRRGLWEIENDLIAAHVLTTGEPPDAQFLG